MRFFTAARAASGDAARKLPGPMAFHIPTSCRRAFRIDVLAGIFLSLGLAFLFLSEPVLRKTLVAPRWLVVLLFSLRMGSMVFSPAWAGASHLRRKVPFVSFGAVVSGLLLVVAAASVPLMRRWLPEEALRGSLFGASPEVLAFFVMTSMVFVATSGFNALQVAVYRQNFPVDSRARIVSRINIFRVGMMLAGSLVAAWLLDRWDFAFCPLMVLGGLSFVVGGLIYRRMHVVGEEAFPTTVNVEELKQRIVPRGIIRLMRENRHFLRFQICQTFHGAGNLVCQSAFLLVMTDELKLDYFQLVLIMTVVPPLMQIVSTTLWAPFVDRQSPSRARVFNTPFWILGMVLFPLSVLVPGGVVFAYLAFASRGVAMGGSTLLWSLGPLHYAKQDDAAHYLAVHNFLTGLRGLVAVAVGGAFFLWLGKWVFALGAAMMVAATVMFYLQDRAERRDPDFRGELDLPRIS